MEPGEHVEVEAGEAHDWVVGVDLIADCEVGHSVPGEGKAIVVAGLDGTEVGWSGGEEGDVLDVWVVFL